MAFSLFRFFSSLFLLCFLHLLFLFGADRSALKIRLMRGFPQPRVSRLFSIGPLRPGRPFCSPQPGPSRLLRSKACPGCQPLECPWFAATFGFLLNQPLSPLSRCSVALLVFHHTVGLLLGCTLLVLLTLFSSKNTHHFFFRCPHIPPESERPITWRQAESLWTSIQTPSFPEILPVTSLGRSSFLKRYFVRNGVSPFHRDVDASGGSDFFNSQSADCPPFFCFQ